MSNPLTLQELADSLAVSAAAALERAKQGDTTGDVNFHAGYRSALLDTRATVLAMIADIDRRIANNNRVVDTQVTDPTYRAISERANEVYQAVLDGRIEAYEDVRGDIHEANPGKFPTGTLPTECVECGKAIKHLPTGWVHEVVRTVHEDPKPIDTGRRDADGVLRANRKRWPR